MPPCASAILSARADFPQAVLDLALVHQAVGGEHDHAAARAAQNPVGGHLTTGGGHADTGDQHQEREKRQEEVGGAGTPNRSPESVFEGADSPQAFDAVA